MVSEKEEEAGICEKGAEKDFECSPSREGEPRGDLPSDDQCSLKEEEKEVRWC